MATIKVEYDANTNIFATFTKHARFTFDNYEGHWVKDSTTDRNGIINRTNYRIGERYVPIQHRQALRNHAKKIKVELVNKNTSPKLDFVKVDLASVPLSTIYQNISIIQDINKAIMDLNRSQHDFPVAIREISSWGCSLYVLASKLMVWTEGSPLIKISKFGGLRVFFSREFPENHILWSRLEVTKDYTDTEV